jgi:hypothetical protein
MQASPALFIVVASLTQDDQSLAVISGNRALQLRRGIRIVFNRHVVAGGSPSGWTVRSPLTGQSGGRASAQVQLDAGGVLSNRSAAVLRRNRQPSFIVTEIGVSEFAGAVNSCAGRRS